jgi:heme A synthase
LNDASRSHRLRGIVGGAREDRVGSFVRFAWGTLLFTVGVVLWGAFVRATGSGAGCGAHWPLCNGVVVPRAPELETLIELTHRATSGVALLLVFALGAWARRRFPAGHRVRRAAFWSVLLILSEALIGAGLVLFGLVADDRSEIRAAVLGLHLVNTFFLLAALTLTAQFAAGGTGPAARWRWSPLATWSLATVAGVLVVGVTGAITALGDTLFPDESLRHGLAQDLSPTAHFLVRLRVYHPLIAIAVSLALTSMAQRHHRRFGTALGRLPNLLVGLVAVQLVAGAANVLLLAPVWLQLVHLALADALWVTLVVLLATAHDTEAVAVARQGAPADPTIAAPIGTASLPKGPG